jgi:hypothetical protein
MANADTPFGLRPVAHRNGAPYNGAFRVYNIAAGDGTATFIGDPVKLAGTASTVSGQIYADVVQGTAAATVCGVVVGFAPSPANLDSRHRAASTQRLVYVADDPDLIFEIQEVSGGTALTANDIGLNANFVVAAGSATTAMSGVELNNATEATTNTLDLHIVGIVQREDNAVGEHCKWLVTLNNHQMSNQVAGV